MWRDLTFLWAALVVLDGLWNNIPDTESYFFLPGNESCKKKAGGHFPRVAKTDSEQTKRLNYTVTQRPHLTSQLID